jgi:PAS domain S-box-containing protein
LNNKNHLKLKKGAIHLGPEGPGFLASRDKSICQMLGYTENEMKNLEVKDIHPEKDLPFIFDIFDKQAKGLVKTAVNIPTRKKDGAIFYADISGVVITLSGKQYMMGSFRDISERKQLQDELNQKMIDLERFSELTVDRELKMEALEKKIKDLEGERPAP